MDLVGKFVLDSRAGPAKVVALEGNRYKIEYFISPWNRKQIVVSLNSAFKPFRLYVQTRVYVEVSGRWKIGRVVLAHDVDDGGYEYDVQFPNNQYQRYSERDLNCRCWLAHDDPTSALALGGVETQYWHEHRQRFAATLLNQRAACRGLTAILSSNIEFVPHQLDVVRRVLEDPLQRYLLADEVGMGKTIEAGLIVRQFLLSNPRGDVWVIVPDSLVQQWTHELEHKFHILDFGDRVHVHALSQIEDQTFEGLELLVIDETHHLVTNQIPHQIQKLVLATPRVLLLSATPSLGKPEVLLRLLKLLDPDCYSKVDLAEFSGKIERRETYGVFIRGLRADASPLVIVQRLRRIPELFQNDQEAQRLGRCVERSLEEEDEVKFRRNLSALRNHIADVHRIHQRLIRTRRRDAADWVFRPRGPVISNGLNANIDHIRRTWVEDSRLDTVFDVFEQWRVQMSSMYPINCSQRSELTKCVVKVFEAIGCGVDCFVTLLPSLSNEFLDATWSETFLIAAVQSNEEPTRSEQIASDVKRHVKILQALDNDKVPRIAIFGSDLRDLLDCANALKDLVGENRVALAWEQDKEEQDIASMLANDNQRNILLCSPSEEEGLNLHFFDAIVHLDLPFSPLRIEQRIGRLDRFGRKLNRLEQRVVFPAIEEHASLWEAWFDLLTDGFHIFNEPISDVQFSLDDITLTLSNVLLDEGAIGLRNSIEKVRAMLSQERERLDDQYALDQVLLQEDSTRSLYQALDDLEFDEHEIADASTGWIVDSLHLSCKGDTHQIFRIKWDQERTLLPVLPWAALFKYGLEGMHTFSRRYALNSSSDEPPQLLRIGSSLMQSIEREYRWDDRGTAFATWRQALTPDQPEWLGFKLCFVVEARLPEGLHGDEKNGLRTRVDGYLSPWTDVLYVDSELNVVDDPHLIGLISAPYGVIASGRDFNLGSRLDTLFSLIDPAQFERLCFSIRTASEDWLRNQIRFKEIATGAYELGFLDIERRNKRLSQRLNNRIESGDLEDSGLSREIELNKNILAVLGNPVVKLDSIGAIVLSSRTPQEFMEGIA